MEIGGSSAVCPWDEPDEPPAIEAPKPMLAIAAPPAVATVTSAAPVQLSVCPWEQEEEPAAPVSLPVTQTQLPAVKTSAQRLTR